ncbi:MAG TPA: hypothetical protein VMI56_24545 [Reyranella sp.]|nr:hypothetical protein [Reyranella sp.]
MGISKTLLVMAIALLPLAAAAETPDSVYCKALASEYQKYYVKTSGHMIQPGPIDGNIASDQCMAGNTAGIPVLERYLRDAKVTLPPRG